MAEIVTRWLRDDGSATQWCPIYTRQTFDIELLLRGGAVRVDVLYPAGETGQFKLSDGPPSVGAAGAAPAAVPLPSSSVLGADMAAAPAPTTPAQPEAPPSATPGASIQGR